MKRIFFLSKEARRSGHFDNCPSLHILIGRYCYDSCYDYRGGPKNCPLKKSSYPKLIDKLTYWLWKHKIIGINKDSGKYSGTKYCPFKLPVIHTCDNCKNQAGYDENFDGICGSEDHRNMTPEQRREDMDNGLYCLCRYWEPDSYDERLKNDAGKN